MFDQLSTDDRLRLLRFVCTFAWADLEVQDEERRYVHRLVKSLALDDREAAQVEAWLKSPPAPETVDPQDIPREHRALFLKTVEELVKADGVVNAREVETYRLLSELLA